MPFRQIQFELVIFGLNLGKVWVGKNITFRNRTMMPYLAPSLDLEFNMNILKLNLKRAPDWASFFYLEILLTLKPGHLQLSKGLKSDLLHAL